MTLRAPSRVTPFEPLLGLYRYVVYLPAGVGRDLAFDGRGYELGNGWFDVTARITSASIDDWLPSDVGISTRDAELLHDLRRPMLSRLRPGDICREPRPQHLSRDIGGDPAWSYRVYDGRYWNRVDVVTLGSPRRDEGGPVGTPAAQLDLEPDAGSTVDDADRVTADA